MGPALGAASGIFGIRPFHRNKMLAAQARQRRIAKTRVPSVIVCHHNWQVVIIIIFSSLHLSSHVSVESVTTSVKVKSSFWKSDWYCHLNVPFQPEFDHHVYFIKAYDHIFKLTGGMQKSQTWYCSKTISLHQLTGINTMKRRRKIHMEKNLKKAKYTIKCNPIP